MVGIAEQIGRSQKRPFGDLVGNVLRGNVAHFEVSALQGNEFGTLTEKRAAVIGLDSGNVTHSIGELAHHSGADVLIGKYGRKPERLCILSHDRHRYGSRDCNRAEHESPAGEI